MCREGRIGGFRVCIKLRMRQIHVYELRVPPRAVWTD